MDKFKDRPTRKSKKRENKKHPYKKTRKTLKERITSVMQTYSTP